MTNKHRNNDILCMFIFIFFPYTQCMQLIADRISSTNTILRSILYKKLLHLLLIHNPNFYSSKVILHLNHSVGNINIMNKTFVNHCIPAALHKIVTAYIRQKSFNCNIWDIQNIMILCMYK